MAHTTTPRVPSEPTNKPASRTVRWPVLIRDPSARTMSRPRTESGVTHRLVEIVQPVIRGPFH
jgi:hypothetical protein